MLVARSQPMVWLRCRRVRDGSRFPGSGTPQPTGVAWFSDLAAWIDRVHRVITDVAVALLSLLYQWTHAQELPGLRVVAANHIVVPLSCAGSLGNGAQARSLIVPRVLDRGEND